MITQARLQALFDYDLETGWFTNRFWRSYRSPPGERAGSPTGHGYRKISIDGQRYYEHHLAWLYVHGEWVDEIDHWDGDGERNAIQNLRPCNRTQNNFNAERSTGQSGLRGAYFDRRVQRWYSKIQVGGLVKWLGAFNTAEEAHIAFMSAVELHHGDFDFRNRTALQG
jgi:hypothetical protein